MITRLKNISGLTELTAWEKSFVTDLISRAEERGDEFILSPKQDAVLAKIERERGAK